MAHAPSENTLSLRDAVERGARSETEIDVRVIAPLQAGPDDVLAARIAARGRETSPDRHARLVRQVPDLPAGLRHWRIVNDTTPEAGIARLCAALDQARAATEFPAS